ncbi:MAG TPA: hypothetical protein VGH02_02085 [Rhizomicrobium sp.]|jgi:hypothetical protein
MFIRFVIAKLDPDSGRRQGLFQAAARLQDSRLLSAHEEKQLQGIYKWFGQNLKKPARLSLSAKPNSKAQAISWFKDTATDHISQMRAFVAMLELHDISVEVLKTERPGYVIYEDAFQIAAYPFADTPT